MVSSKVRVVEILGLLLLVCFVARLTSIARWPKCEWESSCAAAMNVFSMLGAAFPNVLVYPLEVLTNNVVVLGTSLLALNGGFLALVWRVLAPTPTRGASLGLLGGWVVASLISFWFAPHLVWSSVKAVLWFNARS